MRDSTLNRARADRELDDPVRRLELLRDANRGARLLVLGMIAVGFGGQIVAWCLVEGIGSNSYDDALSFTMLGVAWLAYLAIAYRCAGTIARAKGRGRGYAFALAAAAAVVTLITPCFLGYPGCAVLRCATEGEFRRAGVRIGLFGPRRADIEARLEESRAAQSVSAA
jgi:hypothetical protein